jgi:hypothetical protein
MYDITEERHIDDSKLPELRSRIMDMLYEEEKSFFMFLITPMPSSRWTGKFPYRPESLADLEFLEDCYRSMILYNYTNRVKGCIYTDDELSAADSFVLKQIKLYCPKFSVRDNDIYEEPCLVMPYGFMHEKYATDRINAIFRFKDQDLNFEYGVIGKMDLYPFAQALKYHLLMEYRFEPMNLCYNGCQMIKSEQTGYAINAKFTITQGNRSLYDLLKVGK